MTENEKIELFDKWYDENYDEWAEGEEGIALREELEQAFKGGIAELEKENAELKKLFADCDTCKRTCDIGNCCKFGSDYLPDVEKVLNEQKQLTKAKEIIKLLLHALKNEGSDYTFALENTHPALAEAEQFLKEIEK